MRRQYKIMTLLPAVATLLLPAILLASGTDDLPGETMQTAIPVTSLPFTATGNTCAYSDDYAVMCPYGNWAADVVYALTPTEEMNISIELCDSSYDTLVFIYHTDSNPYHLLACNDDRCGDDGYKSAIDRVHVSPGFTYYIVVDGYTDACGDYVLQVNDLGDCIPDCTDIWEEEGEPVCGDQYDDEFNAGCDVFPFHFRPIEPSSHVIRICGTSGWYRLDGTPQVDRDWYEIQVPAASRVDVFCEAEFNVSLQLIAGDGGCDQMTILDEDDGAWCESIAQVSAQLEPGRYFIAIKPVSGSGGCGLGYRLWIDGYLPAATGTGDRALTAGILLKVPTPNPFSSTTMISFDLPRTGSARVTIHDLSGRLVRTLAAENAPAGPGQVRWDGRDEGGRQVASGVYECRLQSGTQVVVKPIIRLR
jgi:hypothetical protein